MMKMKGLWVILICAGIAKAAVGNDKPESEDTAVPEKEEVQKEEAQQGKQPTEASKAEDQKEVTEQAPEETLEDPKEAKDASPAASANVMAAAAELNKAEEAATAEAQAKQQQQASCISVDPSEVKILGALRSRRQTLDRREADLWRREELLRELERKLMSRVNLAVVAIERLEGKLTLGIAADVARKKKLDTLVQSVGSLSVRKSAPVISRIEPKLAALLLTRLGPKKAGSMLGQMDVQKAARIVRELAHGATPAQVAAAKVIETAHRAKRGKR